MSSGSEPAREILVPRAGAHSTLILLAGFSCTGKTTLGRNLIDLLPPSCLFWAADRQQPTAGPLGREPTLDDEHRMLEGNLRSIRGYLDAGFNVVAEIHPWYPRGLEILNSVLGDGAAFIVKLTCSLEVAEAREKARGTTQIGFARAQFENWDLDVRADVVVDTSAAPPQETAVHVLRSWSIWVTPSAVRD